MAILSNVNGKFAVDSTGAIQFSGQTGTSGYVLKSNGNAAPTWVDGSTVIGGPYLPLSGGTLTGATATASGISLTVGGVLTGTTASFNAGATNVVATFTSTDGIAGIALVDSSGNVELSASGNTFQVQPAGGVAALTVSSTNATFAGEGIFNDNISTNADKRVSVGAWDNSAFTGGNAQGFSVQGVTPGLFILETDQTNKKSYLAMSGGGMYLGGSINFLALDTDGARALTLDSSQNATFSGSIIFSDNSYQAAYSIRRNASAIIFSGGTSGYYFNRHNNSVTDVYINGSGNVGIGTDLPTARLNVKASGSTVDQIAVTHSGNTVEIAQLGQSANGNSAGALLLKTNGGTNTVYLDAAGTSYINGGYVGIGTTSPETKLEVAGSIASGTATAPTQLTYNGNLIKGFVHNFTKSKNANTGTAVNATLVDISGIGNFHQAMFYIQYGTRLQSVSDNVTGVVVRAYGVNRFNGGTLQVTETSAIAGSSNSLTHALVNVEIVSNTQYRLRIEFSSTIGGSSFATGLINGFGVGDYFPTITFAEGTAG